MIKVKILLILVLGILLRVDAQNIDGVCSNANIFGDPIENNEFEYIKYQPVLKLTERYSFFNQVKNNTPEELMISQMSVLDNKWLSYNFDDDLEWASEQFERIKTQDRDKNYLELLRKATYTFKNEKYSIIRVNVFDERKKTPIVVSLMSKYKNNRWVLVRNKSKSSIEFFLTNLGLDYLDALFENKNSDNTKFNQFIKSSWVGNEFRLSEAYSKLGNSMFDNDVSLKTIYERNNPTVIVSKDFQKHSPNFSFKKIKIKTDYLIPLFNQKYCTYFINDLSEFKEEGIKKLIGHIKAINLSSEDEKTEIIPIHKFEYSKKEKKIIFIKCLKKIIPNNQEYLTNVFELVDGNLNIYNELDNSDNLIKELISISKQEIITEFSNGEDNPNHPEINKLKPLVKDANGILNIEKLAQVLKENKSALSKYLDQ